MTKADFRKHVIISSILTVIAVAVIIGFFVVTFINWYPLPNVENTSWVSGTVTDVYHEYPRGRVVIAMSNGDLLRLVYPSRVQQLYSEIGYDTTQLADLLEGKNIDCLRMNHCPWAVEIHVDDIIIDNYELTVKQTIATRAGGVILGLMCLVFTISGNVLYLKPKYKCYIKAEKKRARKAKQDMKKF